MDDRSGMSNKCAGGWGGPNPFPSCNLKLQTLACNVGGHTYTHTPESLGARSIALHVLFFFTVSEFMPKSLRINRILISKFELTDFFLINRDIFGKIKRLRKNSNIPDSNYLDSTVIIRSKSGFRLLVFILYRPRSTIIVSSHVILILILDLDLVLFRYHIVFIADKEKIWMKKEPYCGTYNYEIKIILILKIMVNSGCDDGVTVKTQTDKT